MPARAVAGPDYRLGNGDVLDVQIAGRLEVNRLQVIVDPEGLVNIPPLGAIPVGGLTLLESNRRISERARTLLRFADVSIAVAIPRSFEVVVSGEVERPGAVQALAIQRLHEIILVAGGITPRGSARHVVVTQGGVSREVDVLRFELRGELDQNPYVVDGMRVHVPARAAAVSLAGAVRRPGDYELGTKGSLSELLELTGGLAPGGAGSDARLTRIGPDGRKETSSIDLRAALAPPADVPLQGGDTVFVPPLSVLQDVVEVRGAFVGVTDSSKTITSGKPTIVQRFELAQGERVRDVVLKAGGAAAYADLRLSFVDRAGPTGPRQRIPIDMQRLLVEKDETQNILLQNGDVLMVPVVEDKVYVVGEVRAPGAQDYRPDLTPREYVALAGGPGNRARIAATSVTFRNGRTYAMAEAPPLEPGAVVTVPEVAVKWWQDYVQIASLIASLITAYTGIFILFNGNIGNNNSN
ncbi:MAG TPA: SLBB domain-containing protein [Methylomirabilota bacterium]|jgi:protein involved in polysaccharide export with SLBB domain|nr:SLBB domain-containing protein [Methylomirabilota bacterium]